MNQWPFVAGAYAVAVAVTVVLLAWAYLTMRRAEAAADALKRPDFTLSPEVGAE